MRKEVVPCAGDDKDGDQLVLLLREQQARKHLLRLRYGGVLGCLP